MIPSKPDPRRDDPLDLDLADTGCGIAVMIGGLIIALIAVIALAVMT